MNKIDLIRKVKDVSGVNQDSVDKVISALCKVVVEEVRDNGEDIQLPGVGTFKQKDNPEHEGFNPLTKTKITVPHSVTIRFQVSSAVKKIVEKKKKK